MAGQAASNRLGNGRRTFRIPLRSLGLIIRERRAAHRSALARIAASLAAEGAAPERWQPIFDALEEAAAAESGS